MIQNLVLKTLKTLVVILLTVSCQNKPPLIDLVQIDAVHNQANQFHINKYNADSCKMESSFVQSFPITIDGAGNPKFHGGFWISADDFAKLKSWGVTECKNKKVKNDVKQTR